VPGLINFKANKIDPVLEALNSIGERTLSRKLATIYKEGQNEFFKARIKRALRIMFADLRTEVSDEIKRHLKEKAGYDAPETDNYYDVIEKAVTSLGIRGPEMDDVIQKILMEMFGGKGGADFFTLYDPSKGRSFAAFLYARTRQRAMDHLRGVTRQLKEEESITPRDDEEGPSMELKDKTVEDLDVGMEFGEMLKQVEEHLQTTRTALRLPELWEHLLEGQTKSEIAESMGLRSPNITKRYKDLKEELLKLADSMGWTWFGKMLENTEARLMGLGTHGL